MTRFATATRMSISEATGLTLATLRASYPPVDPDFGFHRRTGGDTGRSVNGVFVQERWLLARCSRYCPDCLASDGTVIQQQYGGSWNKLWHLPVVFACPTHRQLLAHSCPSCTQPALSRSSEGGLVPRPAGWVPHPAACRNRLPDARAHTRDICGYRLDTVPTAQPAESLDLDPILNLQDHLLHLLRDNQTTTSVGGPATAAQYVIDLRVLSCLITASWPAAATLIQLGPTVGAAHVIARTGIASFTAKRRHYPRVRPARFAHDHLPQRIPTEWINPYFSAFADLHPRPLHHVIVARLAHMVLGGIPNDTNLSQAVLPLGMSNWATRYALAHITERLTATNRQTSFDYAVNALADHLDAGLHDLTNYGRRRHALADWSIPATDWTRLTDGLPTRIQTTKWRWRHLPWDERERTLASVWIWYHATHGDRTYNQHMKRDWANLGRVSATAKYVNSRWHQLTNGDGLYQPLRDRLDAYLCGITLMIDEGEGLSGEGGDPRYRWGHPATLRPDR